MFNTRVLKIVAIASIAGAALSASAFQVTEGGSYTNPGTNNESLTTLYQFSDVLGNNFTGPFQYTYDLTTNSGSFDFTGNGLTFAGTFSGATNYVGITHSFAGTWTAGAGTSAGFGATGSYTFNFDGVSQWSMSYTGSYQAVPEPASYAVLGMGLVSLVGLRRKRS